MSEPKGPKVDIPEELVEELDKPTPLAEAEESPSGDPVSDDPDSGDPEAELAALNDKHLRLAAEFDNFRRRTLKERQDLLNYGNESLMKELLDTIDNLERALGHARESKELDRATILEGLELTQRSLLQTLAKFGVQAVEASGKPFDPQLHEAIRQVPSTEHAAGTVLDVFQTGYVLMDRLLRPAMVAVAGPGGSGSEGDE